MLSLLVVILSVVLVVVLSIVAVTYIGEAYVDNQADAAVAQIISQGSQISAAAEVYLQDHPSGFPVGFTFSNLQQALGPGGRTYLKGSMTPPLSAGEEGMAWAFVAIPNSRAFYIENKINNRICRRLNKKVAKNSVIPARAYTGLDVQCFGAANEKNTVVFFGVGETESGMTDACSKIGGCFESGFQPASGPTNNNKNVSEPSTNPVCLLGHGSSDCDGVAAVQPPTNCRPFNLGNNCGVIGGGGGANGGGESQVNGLSITVASNIVFPKAESRYDTATSGFTVTNNGNVPASVGCEGYVFSHGNAPDAATLYDAWYGAGNSYDHWADWDTTNEVDLSACSGAFVLQPGASRLIQVHHTPTSGIAREADILVYAEVEHGVTNVSDVVSKTVHATMQRPMSVPSLTLGALAKFVDVPVSTQWVPEFRLNPTTIANSGTRPILVWCEQIFTAALQVKSDECPGDESEAVLVNPGVSMDIEVQVAVTSFNVPTSNFDVVVHAKDAEDETPYQGTIPGEASAANNGYITSWTAFFVGDASTLGWTGPLNHWQLRLMPNGLLRENMGGATVTVDHVTEKPCVFVPDAPPFSSLTWEAHYLCGSGGVSSSYVSIWPYHLRGRMATNEEVLVLFPVGAHHIKFSDEFGNILLEFEANSSGELTNGNVNHVVTVSNWNELPSRCQYQFTWEAGMTSHSDFFNYGEKPVGSNVGLGEIMCPEVRQ